MKKLRVTIGQYLRLEASFRVWLDALGYATSTVYELPRLVREFFHFLEQQGKHGLQAVEAEDVVAYLDMLGHRKNHRRGGGLSKSHIAKHRQALVLLSRYLSKSGQGGLPMPEEVPLKEHPSPTTVLTVQEIRMLYAACQDDRLGLRDRAMLSVYYGCGLRRSEGWALEVNDILFDQRLIYVRRGKASRERYVPMAAGMARDLTAYLDEAHPQMARLGEAAVFVSQRGHRMESQSLMLRLKRLAERCPSLQGQRVGLHTLRHSIATHLLQAGMPLKQIARFLGHRSLESTQIYTHLVRAIDEQL